MGGIGRGSGPWRDRAGQGRLEVREAGREGGRESTAKTPRPLSQYGGHNNAGHGVLTAIPMG